jgi:GxxExxY protein
VPLPVVYKDKLLDLGFRIDLLVEESLVVEVKSLEALNPVHKKQVLTYLRLAERKLGILVNFNVARLEDKQSIIHIVNGY